MSDVSTPQHNEQCTDEQHSQHLCFLQYEGFHFGHRKEYKALVQHAEHLCRNCGRTAGKAANLCDPVAL